MAKYSGANLAAMSTILGCATRTQVWNALGTRGGETQEEVQMMWVKDGLFIACNGSGHTYIQNFLTALGVSDEKTLLEALKWSHILINAKREIYKDWYCDVANKSVYSVQEKSTVDAFAFPAGVPKTAADTDNAEVYNCVGKMPRGGVAPTKTDDWKVGPFQQLLGWYSNKPGYKSAYGAHPLVSIGTKSLTQAYDSSFKITLINNSSATIHAEIKLLAYLTKMIVEGNIDNTDVYLGGLKGACKECSKWIGTYAQWLKDHRYMKLHLPKGDTRPSATPVNWAKPPLEGSVKTNSALTAIAGSLFA